MTNTEITGEGITDKEAAPAPVVDTTEVAPESQQDRKTEFNNKFRALIKTDEVEAESTTEEIAVEEVKEPVTEVKKEEMFSSKWRALAKKEKSLFERENTAKETEAKNKEIEEVSKLLNEDPLKFMKARGITYEQLIDTVLNESSGTKEAPEVNKLNERIKKMEEAERQRVEEVDNNKQRQLANEYTNRMKEQISNSGEYEILNGTKSYQLVVDVIYEEYQKSGKELEIATAAEMVEKFLENRLGEQLDNLTKIDKIRKKLGLDIEAKETTDEEIEEKLIEEVVLRDEPAPVKKVTKTLTNSNTSASPTRVEKPLTHNERKALFNQRLKGNMTGLT